MNLPFLHPPAQPTPPGTPELGLRLGVHDRSRVEWVATVPMAPAGEQHTYETIFEAEIADAMWVAHQPWEHFTIRTRLTSPVLAPGQQPTGPAIDQLRRRALATAHALKEQVPKAVRIVQLARLRDLELREGEAADVAKRLQAMVSQAVASRAAFEHHEEEGDPALHKEYHLALEYISTQILMAIARLASVLRGSKGAPGKRGRALNGAVAVVQEVLRETLQSERAFRRSHGLPQPAAWTAHDVELYINRSAQLKKHFQQALFLDASGYMLDQRLRNWIAALVAMIASTFYFVWQVYYLNARTSTGGTTVSLVMAGLIAALVYAAKDRIKEVGRDWVADKLKHSYADRVVDLRLQERMDPHRSQFGLARETITVRRILEPDLLNPALGRTAVIHHLHVRELIRHNGMKLLSDQGLCGMKHVFRYDLSPLLLRLDDKSKRVPELRGGEVSTMAASRVYRIPVHVRLQRVGAPDTVVLEQRGVLLLRRRGLEGFVRTDLAGRSAARLEAP